MKNPILLLLLSGIFVLIASVDPNLTVFSARLKNDEVKQRTSDADVNDKDLAATIRRLTNRDDSLIDNDYLGGGRADLLGGFQDVAVVRRESEGDLTAMCVTSLSEANAFFGRDLETGRPERQTEIKKPTLAEIAAAHGMGESDFVFYSRLIEEAMSQRAMSPNSATVGINNNDGPGEGFNDPSPAFVVGEGGNAGTTKGAQRVNVFTFAAGIWGAFIDTSVPIFIGSQMNPLTCSTSGGVLGSAGATTVHRDFLNAQVPGTWYAQALANKQAGSDLDSGNLDINATFNISIDSACLGAGTRWYYGLDNATPPNRINLMVVLLHEMGHGLGFQTFANGGTGVLFNGLPDQWSRFMYDNTTGAHWNTMTNAQRQASAVSNGALRWDGPNVVLDALSSLSVGKDAQNRPELYAPVTYQSGSSVSHYSTTATPNVLMEPIINTGLPINLDLTRQLMRDIGWYRDTTADLVPDTITGVTPGIGSIIIGSSRTITWTNNGSFSKNVSIELSTNGGATFPTALASNVANTGSFTWTVPNLPTTQAQIRVREYNFISPIGVTGNFVMIAPSAAQVAIGGRVVSSDGRAIARATVTATSIDGNTHRAITNSFGYYRIDGLTAGSTYTISITQKLYQFQSQIVGPQDDLTEIDIFALP